MLRYWGEAIAGDSYLCYAEVSLALSRLYTFHFKDLTHPFSCFYLFCLFHLDFVKATILKSLPNILSLPILSQSNLSLFYLRNMG